MWTTPAIVGFSLTLLGCLSGGSSRPRTDGTCFIDGCNSEVCADRSDLVTPCLWRDAYVCFRDAICERQSDATCGWTQTDELKACLASHDPLPGS